MESVYKYNSNRVQCEALFKSIGLSYLDRNEAPWPVLVLTVALSSDRDPFKRFCGLIVIFLKVVSVLYVKVLEPQ